MTTTFLILSGCALGDSGGGQQPAQIARELAAVGHQVYHYQPRDSALYVPGAVTEIACPSHLREAYWSHDAVGAAEHWSRLLGALPVGYLVVCCALPWYARGAEVARQLGWKVVYWIIDDWARLYQMEGVDFYEVADEITLVRMADTVLATAPQLAAKVHGRPCPVIGNGYNSAHFPILRRTTVEDTSALSLIYWGYLQGAWFDWDLLVKISLARPEWTIHLYGAPPVKRPPLANVMFHGEANAAWLSRLSAAGDVALIPFISSPAIDAVDPIKAYEYTACGLPIVSCHMPALDDWPGVTQAPGIASIWVDAIERSASVEVSGVERFLAGKTWHDRSVEFLEAIGVREAVIPFERRAC